MYINQRTRWEKKIIKYSYVLLSLCTISCSAQKINNIGAVKYYQNQLSIVENSLKTDKNEPNSFSNAIEILENVTNIKSYKDESDFGDFRIPVSFNISDWKEWLTINKANLQFDKSTKQLSVNNAIALAKNPTKLFQKYIFDLINMERKEHYKVEEINYILNHLNELTGYSIKFSDKCDCRFPTEQDFKLFTKWYGKNENNLSWNLYKQRIELKN